MSERDITLDDMSARVRAAAISVQRNGWPYGEWYGHVARIAAAGSDKTPEDFVAFMRQLSPAELRALKREPHTAFAGTRSARRRTAASLG